MSRKPEWLAALLCAVMLCAAPAFAAKRQAAPGQIEKWRNEGILYYEGKERFIRRNYEKAHEFFELAGGAGDATSLYYLGNMYSEGLGVLQDEEKARLLYLRAAEKGQPDSQLLTAVFLIMDGIIEKNPTRQKLLYADAVRWLEQSAEQGNMEAHFWLGDMLTKGLGTKQDTARGKALMRKAADAGNPNALAMVAAYHWRGLEGEKKDLLKAHALMHKAHRLGNEQAWNLLEQMEAEMMPEQLAAAEAAAKTYDAQRKKEAENAEK